MEHALNWIEHTLAGAEKQALHWINQYGYHAVVPTLLIDPAGVPWAWIFLMVFAEGADKNVTLMLTYGFVVLSLADHGLYWLGIKGGRPFVEKVGRRWPKIARTMHEAEASMRGRGIWMVTIGRYLPFVGRWVGMGAGLANVPFARFAFYDALGVALTVVGFGLVAHLIGRQTINQPWFPKAFVLAFIVGTIITALLTIWQLRVVRQRRQSGIHHEDTKT
ncbi:MAG: VTT domain-containing protein [Armatimonadota bacterium]|nr:VTT domain-containing protein [Armatimonadota bacterium]